MEIVKPINLYTDGSCAGNQFDSNCGGWGAVLEYGERLKEISGSQTDTTNNRMEMMALIMSLAEIQGDGRLIRVFSDSSYLINGLKKRWYENWLRNGWKTANKSPVENRDLWESLIKTLPIHTFEYYLVKGHISPDASEATLKAAYKKFIQHNGDTFSYDEFLHIVRMNNRADTLATGK